MGMLGKILAFVLLALSAAAAAASSREPVSERSWVEDPTGTMTLAQVVAAPQQPLTGPYFGQGFSTSAFWIRLRIDPAKWPDARKRPPNTLPTRGARTALTARGSASPQAISYWGDAGCQL
jgi:hypothetical protein